MQPINTPEDKIRKIRKYLAWGSVVLFALAALLLIITIFTSKTILFQIAYAAIILSITSFAISWNVSRFHGQSKVVQILSKISVAADIVAAIMLILNVFGISSIIYNNCYSSFSSNYHYSDNYMQCIENANTLISVFSKIGFIAFVLAISGEIISRYLALNVANKSTNIVRWVAVSLVTLLSLAVIIFLLFNVPLGSFIMRIALTMLVLCLLSVVVTPILLFIDKSQTNTNNPFPEQSTMYPTQDSTPIIEQY